MSFWRGHVRRGGAALAALALVGAAACGDDGSEASGAQGSGSDGGSVECGPGGEPRTISVARTAGLVTEWDTYVAEDQGFYEANGVETEVVEGLTATPAVQALLAGEVDVAIGSHPAILANDQTGGASDLIVVADSVIRPPYALVVETGIEDYEDLAGTELGVSGPTDSAGVNIRDLLAAEGLAEDDVALIPTGGTADRYAALQSGAIAGTVLIPPANFRATADGFSQLAWIPEARGADWTSSFYNYVVGREWAEDNRETLVCFLRAQDQGLRWLADPANRDGAITILAERLDMTLEEAAETYDLTVGGELSIFSDAIQLHPDALQANLDELEAIGELQPPLPDVDDFSDPSYADAAREG